MGDVFLSSSSHSPSPPPPPPPPPTWAMQTTVLYSEPASQLPAPLPSIEEIENSPHVLKKLSSRCAVRVGQHYVAKYGEIVEPIEGKNMMFARQHLKSIVPRVFAIYQRPGWKSSPPITYIIMEYFPGRPLSEAWDKMDEVERLKVFDTLRNAFQTLRSLPSPDYFGGLGNTKLNDDLFWTDEEPIRTMNGPFHTEDELIHAAVQQYRKLGDRMHPKADYYSRVLPQVLRGNGKSVFTHGDLQRKNIMVGDGGEVAIIDWAASGWYPTYWEYAITMFAFGGWQDDWHRYIPKMLSEFPNQYSWLNMLRLEMFS